MSLHQRCADGDAEPAHDNADRRLRYSQPFGGATDMLLLQNSHGDGELRADQLQPFTILINHLKKFIGLIDIACGIVVSTHENTWKKGLNSHEYRR
ncbi:hypothetical protein [Mycobacterium sp.]|uniref:hypothetical protein n=1 Tax=Mycobacterium sp. TaxID=1785 RepID=UPI003F983219